MQVESILSAKEISKSFPTQTVLKSCSFDLEKGEKALLFGANGAGKSTLLRILAGLMRAESGEMKYRGENVTSLNPQKFCFLGHSSQLYNQLSVEQNLRLNLDLRGLKRDLDQELAFWELGKIRSKAPSDLSRGTHTRVALCRALMHQPELILLDEPTTSLDQPSCMTLLRWIQAHPESSCLIATHDPKSLIEIASSVLLLRNGKITKHILDGDRSNLVNYYLEAVSR